MKTLLFFIAALVSSATAQSVSFDSSDTGKTPSAWTAAKTRSGKPKWSGEKDDTEPSKPNVLKQSGKATYPICNKHDTNLKDGFVEVKLKPASGKEDQAGGVTYGSK